MPIIDEDMALALNIGAAAKVTRQSHDDIHHAMFSGALPHHVSDRRRVVKLGDLLAWMRRQPISAQAAEYN